MGESKITIAAVGDVMLGDRAIMVGLGVRSCLEKSDTYDPFLDVKNLLNKHDIVFGNLEAVISDKGLIDNNYKSAQMRGTSKSIRLLKEAGFNVLSIANNHIMQHGDAAFFETVETLSDNGIDPVGSTDACGKSIPIYKTFGDSKLCFIGFSMRPEKYSPNPKYAQGNFDNILNSVKILRNTCNFLVVSIHWGDEYVKWPSKKQIQQARALVDNGASLILGHHPHVIQGIEKYKKSLIAYSLGNFVFDVWQSHLRQSYILTVTIINNELHEFKRVPIYIDNEFKPIIISSQNANNVISKYDSLDALICKTASESAYYDKYYKYHIKLNEIKNQVENRIIFLRNIFKYNPWVIKQSIFRFLEDRIK